MTTGAGRAMPGDREDGHAVPSLRVRPRIAIYADSFAEITFAKLFAALAALPADFRPVLLDHGPIPLIPEASASVPPWTSGADAVLVDTGTQGDPHALAEWIRRGAVPAVSLNAELLDTGIPTVCADYRELGRLAAEHLVADCGCNSFVYVGCAASQATPRRAAAFCEALARLGHDAHVVATRVGLTTTDAAPPLLDDPQFTSLVQRLRRPIGVFAGQDGYAAGAVALCRRLSLRGPDSVAVLGVGNSMLAHVHRPSLSSIHVQRTAMGARGMTLLRGLLEGRPASGEPTLVGGSVLHARESTMGSRRSAAVRTVDMAMERILADACSGLTVDRLAEELDVSDRWLRKLFEDECGVSPNHEIQRMRFEEAGRLLKHTRLPLGRIAAMVGFSHATGLSMFFRRMIGMTPRDYRGRGFDPARRPGSGSRR